MSMKPHPSDTMTSFYNMAEACSPQLTHACLLMTENTTKMKTQKLLPAATFTVDFSAALKKYCAGEKPFGGHRRIVLVGWISTASSPSSIHALLWIKNTRRAKGYCNFLFKIFFKLQ